MSCCCDNDELDTIAADTPAVDLPRTVCPRTPPAFYRGLSVLAHWLLPLATLALIPKCPACVAAYVLLVTGVGLSFTAAVALRWVVIVASIIGLACLIIRTFKKRF